MKDDDHSPSRFLNEPTGFFGLTALDASVVGYVFILFHAVLDVFNLELLSFGVALLFAYALSVIRLNRRRKSIRDFLRHTFLKRTLHDPKT